MLLRLEKFLFYAFLFLIPFQIRATISWQGSEWNSIFLYLTDLLLIGFLFFGFIDKRISIKKTDILLFLFLLIAGISIFASSNLGVSIYRFVKLLEFAFLYIYVRGSLHIYSSTYKVLLASGFFQSILAIAQFYKQSSLGIKFIEAGQYLPGAAGVATFISNDTKIIRAYGSFPTPMFWRDFYYWQFSVFTVYG